MAERAVVEHTGWLLDLYPHPQDGAVLWLLDESAGPQRLRLRQPFPVTFYVAGPPGRLRQLWRYLESQPVPVHLGRLERRDLFTPQPVTVLAVRVEGPAAQPGLFRQVSRAFPELAYYDADLPFNLHHAARYGTFPLARCRLAATDTGQVQELEVLDSPWELDPPVPPLRIMSLEPDVDPSHASPKLLLVRQGRYCYRLSLENGRPLLVNLRAILRRHDPDLLLTVWGDTWLLPHLLELSASQHLPLPLNRDPTCEVEHRQERTYFTYGQVMYRGRQVHLFGRWHVDGHNAMLYHDYGLEGVFELGRVTALPFQTVARVSPGSGISAMQMLTALRQGVLVPWHKQQAERPKSALDLLRADMGGLVYQPLIGLHRDVAEIDFISMYPSIMARFNVSPETVGAERPTAELVPELGEMIARGRPGLVPLTLTPLLKKRIALKAQIARLPPWDPRRRAYKARSTAHKWLLVTCFGYLGYKNARFGRIEAHEAVTAYGREALLRAKEAVEDLGGEVLHMYVDGIWAQVPGLSRSEEFQPLLDEIGDRTGLPVALDGVYRWVAFLPSRVNGRVPVANRYFGVFQDGSLKMRGIELRRQDTCPWIARLQLALLEHLAQAASVEELPALLPGALRTLRRAQAELRRGRVPLDELLVSQKLSKELADYSVPSPSARAAMQLCEAGKTVKQGQRVRFLYTLGEPGVHAWDLPQPPSAAAVDVRRYLDLLRRAALTVLEPLGVGEDQLRDWLASNAAYGASPGYLVSPDQLALEGRPPLPLFVG
ncbi:MAG TPA: DNA polymerase domain-containing protein [Anaerolineales bacterium]|nr:DNA polymerase domain-containing protein [Anaerolineales bacterium]